MITQETYELRPDGTELIRTYSDEGKYIRKEGTLDLYAEAIDVAPAPEYEETDIDVESLDNIEDEDVEEGE